MILENRGYPNIHVHDLEVLSRARPWRWWLMAAGRPGRVRIIAGAWRGRRLAVATVPGLRPTGDRIRETLFNWLAPHLPGARCLDLFSGSGALGLEAASRGAARVVMLEQDPRAMAQLRRHCETLRAARVEPIQADALQWLRRTEERFDIVFVDPPFAAGLTPEVLALLRGGRLAGQARVYVELAAADALDGPGCGWRVLREKRAGKVRYALLEVVREQGTEERQ